MADDRRLAAPAAASRPPTAVIAGLGAEDGDADVDGQILVIGAGRDQDGVAVRGRVDRRLDRRERAEGPRPAVDDEDVRIASNSSASTLVSVSAAVVAVAGIVVGDRRFPSPPRSSTVVIVERCPRSWQRRR